jgi:Cu(I)/Ag(I) efflux system membrane fusion protein
MNKLLLIAFLALASFANAKTLYQCPMHPQIIREEPGTCPICHMTLEKIEGPEHAAGTGGQRAAFTLPAARQQLIGVKTMIATKAPLTKILRLAGRVGGGGVVAQLMEMDAGLVKVGQHASLRGPGGQTLSATVSGVEGSLDSLTRSFGVFISPIQGAGWLRSGVYCEAQVEVPLGSGIALPADAVLVTGDQAVVFVRKDKEHFEPRQVELGHQDDAWVEVSKGLQAGEEVVTGANFLIDSEARFKAAIEAYASAPAPLPGGEGRKQP